MPYAIVKLDTDSKVNTAGQQAEEAKQETFKSAEQGWSSHTLENVFTVTACKGAGMLLA